MKHECMFCGQPCDCKDFMLDDPDYDGQIIDNFDCIGCEFCAS